MTLAPIAPAATAAPAAVASPAAGPAVASSGASPARGGAGGAAVAAVRLRGQLEAVTPAGRGLVALVEAVAPAVAAGAAEADRTATFPRASLGMLRDAGVLRAAVPAMLGGLGVTSVHDLVVAASRLARADPSLAIGVNMHLVTTHAVVRAWRHAAAAGDDARAVALGTSLRALAASGAAVASAVSEPGPQDLSRPATRAVRLPAGGDDGGDGDGDRGWVLDGVKAFCTMSPGADLLNVAFTYVDDAGRERYGFATVPAGAPGVTVHDDWDALGMRASGSGRVTFAGVRLGAHAVRDSHPAGEPSAAGLDRFLTSGLFHAAATLGIAEAAHLAVVGDGTGPSADRRARLAAGGRTRTLVAENAVDLDAMRAVLARAATVAGAHLDHADGLTGADGGAGAGEGGDGLALRRAQEAFAAAQTAKAFVDRAGVRVVDRALELSGGAGYLAAHPLSRAYRDVRAGAFMHPLGANRAYDVIGQVELGQAADLR